jgi:lipopolysaccharide transport system permease protein
MTVMTKSVPAGSPLFREVLSEWDPRRILRDLWAYRDLIRQLTVREVRQRYQGSYLGTLWSLLTPLLTLVVYTFVFSVVLGVRWGSSDRPTPPADFALTLFAGLIPFNVFAEVVTRAPTLVLSVPNYVKRVRFPLEVLPVVALGTALAQSLFYGLVLLGGELVLWRRLPWTLVWLPLAYLPLVFLCAGLGWFLASVGVYVRDIGPVVAVLVHLLFFLTPVVYPTTAVPESLRMFIYLNPLTTVVSGFRRVLLWDDGLPWGPWAGWTALTAGLAWLGYVWFVKTRKGFIEVL